MFNRDQLVRKTFDAQTDIVWVETSRQEAERLGVDPAQLEYLREAFNKHMEARDWEWWQKRTESYSTARLASMLEDAISCRDALDGEEHAHQMRM